MALSLIFKFNCEVVLAFNQASRHDYLRRLSGKYPAILNISRTGRLALMQLGSQSEETLQRIREQSLSRGASQSAVRSR